MNSKPKTDEVPVKLIQALSDDRFCRLSNNFIKEFGSPPMYFVKVPGRVNIIGEHIDYCGYPVLPMAVEQDIIIAASLLDEPKLCIRNSNAKYSNYETILTCYENINILPDVDGKPFWYSYVLCGIKGGLEFLRNNFAHGLQLCIDGNIPPASGLSSSSALVSAACLAFLYGQKAKLIKTDIASLCAESEKYIGTQGGGMDQAIAFLAEKHSAQYITFDPLNAVPVALPENAAFVVAHSLAEANKAATNDFNRRVIECRLAAQVLAKCEGLITNNKIVTLCQVQKNLNKSLIDMIHLVRKHLPEDVYEKSELCNILAINENDIDRMFLTPNTRHLTLFKLKQRALHVYEEALRVENFRKLCTIDDFVSKIKDLGQLMSDSHESLKTQYECSHANLDLLVEISKEIGVSARLTGAGWGGCIVALCNKDEIAEYVDTIADKFYVKHCNLNKNDVNSYVFATTPNEGAIVYKYER